MIGYSLSEMRLVRHVKIEHSIIISCHKRNIILSHLFLKQIKMWITFQIRLRLFDGENVKEKKISAGLK